MYIIFKRPDIVHVHAIGPSIVVPILKMAKLKVVLTHHGPDYERQKWGKFSKNLLKLSEKIGVKYSDKIIVISNQIKIHIEKKYSRNDSILIPNGVNVTNLISPKGEILKNYGLSSTKYIFTLGRFVKEKGFDYLIDAYLQSRIRETHKLVIAGGADHENNYSKELKLKANTNGIILTGFIKGEILSQMFQNSDLFVLPSFYEGLPIALLEAMSYKLNIICSDIPANLEVGLPKENYFKVGEIEALANLLTNYSKKNHNKVDYDLRRYEWKEISLNTYKVYLDTLNLNKIKI